MKIGHIELSVANPLKSKEFYVNVLGFKVVYNQDDKFLWLKLGEQEILLRPGQGIKHSETFNRSPSNIVFYTDNLVQKRSELVERGLKFIGEDHGSPTFSDLDGNWFQLVNPNEH